jgi:hypothetical protein
MRISIMRFCSLIIIFALYDFMFIYDDKHSNKEQLMTTLFHLLACTQQTNRAFSLVSNRYRFNLSFHMGDICACFFLTCMHTTTERYFSLEQWENIVQEKKKKNIEKCDKGWMKVIIGRPDDIVFFLSFFSTNCCPFLFVSGHACLTLIV